MDTLLEQILHRCRPFTAQGKVPTYIPELSKVDAGQLGICVLQPDGNMHCAGDYQARFTLQSVVKPMILLQALIDSGAEQVRALVGAEATGKPFDAFNYSDQALAAAHINPMINTGAIALCTLIRGESYQEKFQRLLALVHKITGNPTLSVDMQVYHSESATGHKNRALGYMLKAYGMIHDDVEQVVDCYFKACSIAVDCRDLARIADAFSRHGAGLFDAEYARYVNATLMTSGMYDGSGEFALQVGFPAKSGVGGGILGVVPGKMGIGVFSPALDNKGNSLAGVRVLAELSRELNLSVF